VGPYIGQRMVWRLRASNDIQTMTEDHHKDLEDFVKKRDTTADPALKTAVAKGVEMMKHHLEKIEMVAHRMNLSVPSNV